MMSQPVSGLGCVAMPLRSHKFPLLQTLPILALMSAAALAGSPARAQERFTPVHFWAAGRVVPLKTSAISNGKETYIPLTALSAIGARGTLTSKPGSVKVTLRSGRADVLSYTRRSGMAMINLADLAETTDAYVIKPVAVPSKGLQPYTAYLLAHVTDVHLQGNAVHVTTSFPVPFASRDLPGANTRGYVDCIGAVVSRGFRPVALPAGHQRVERLRIGQFSPNVARIVVDLAPGVTLESNSTGGRVTPTYIASLNTGNRVPTGGIATHRSPRTGRAGTASPDDSGELATLPRSHRGTSVAHSNPYPDQYKPGSNNPGKAPKPVEETTLKPHKTTPRSTTGTASAARMTEIRSISYDTPDNQTIQIFIETNRKAKAYVRYSATTRQVVVDIPNSRLNLDDDRQKDQEISHPLIQGLVAETVQNSPRIPPLTRITLDAPRVVSTSVDSQSNQIVLEVTVPQTSRKNQKGRAIGLRGKAGLRQKLIVVDAGHGGAMTGAKGRTKNHIVYEKDITLAIAARLRAALQAQGSHVVMTRVKDVNVPLADRPRLANEVGANVFVSIHNDSWGKPNSVTGTSTYFHKSNARSRALARCIQKELSSVSGMRNRGIVSDVNLYPGGLCVLRETNMPAVLCEVGYINNAKDRSKLLNADFQQRVAEAVCTGVCNFVAGSSHTAHRRKKQIPEA